MIDDSKGMKNLADSLVSMSKASDGTFINYEDFLSKLPVIYRGIKYSLSIRHKKKIS
jgi:hypothetical protein